MTQHARLSPSSRHRWAVCPGSVKEESKYPDVSSAAADDGTHSHTLLEHCVKNNLESPFLSVDVEFSDHVGPFVVDSSRAERVAVAVDYAQSVLDEHPDAQVFAEQSVSPKAFTNRDDMSGTLDIRIEGPDYLEIIDYKDGVTPVIAENNLQLEQYAISVLAEKKDHVLSEVVMTVIQPKLKDRGLDPVTKWVVSVEKLRARVNDLIAQAEATDDPASPLITGDHCRFCRAKNECPARTSDTMEDVAMLFKPLMDDVVDLKIESPASLTDEQIRHLVENTSKIKKFLDEVQEIAEKRFADGQKIAGLKLVKGRSSREWNLPSEEIVKKLANMGAPKAALLKQSVISPAAAEKLVWIKDGNNVTFSPLQLKRIAQEYITRSEGKLVVVPESDPREAATSSLFESVSQPESQSETSLPSWLF